MDLREAKMCRLCGQFERICIDVFGTEGTNHLLSLKIRKKINIQVKKSDKLPQQICPECYNKLISWNDFYDLCHKTQKKFNKKQSNKKVAKNKKVVENDDKSNADEENIPSSINNKRHQRSLRKLQNISEERLTNTVIKEEVDIIDEQPLKSLVPLSDKVQSPKTFNSDLLKFIKEEVDIINEQPLEPLVSLSYEVQSPKTLHLLSNKEQLLESLPPLSTDSEQSPPETLHLLSNKEQSSEPLHSLSNKEQSSEPLHSLSNKKQLPVRLYDCKVVLPKLIVRNHCSPKLPQNESNVPTTLTSSVQSNQLNNDNNFNESKYIKISERITEEQREAIKTYYIKDQSIIETHRKEVQQNMIVEAKNIIKCKICRLTFSKRDHCELHLWTHLNIKPFKCKKCNFVTAVVHTMRNHIMNHLMIKPFVCTVCLKQYTRAYHLKTHMKTHISERPYKCDMCEFSSFYRHKLNQHMTHVQHKLNETICKICDKDFKSLERLCVHMRCHNKNFVACDICGSYFSNLELHKKKIHGYDYNRSKTYKSKSALNNHTKVQTLYRCAKCPKAYKSKHFLAEHILRHDIIRRYKCPVCAKRFSFRSNLITHQKMHSSPEYQCPNCLKKFHLRHTMKIHQKECKKSRRTRRSNRRLVKKQSNYFIEEEDN